MKKPNPAQMALLLSGLGGALAVIIYYKYFNTAAPAAAPPAASSGSSSFTGSYSTYDSHYVGADGVVNHAARCKQLLDTLAIVQNSLANYGNNNMTPAQASMFKNQEMQLLSQIQRLNCRP